MAQDDADSLPLLPGPYRHLATTEAGPSRPSSRARSRPPSRARSTRTSMEERDRGRSRDAEWQAQTEPRSISSHRDRDKDEENGHVLFKAPADELDDHDDLTTVPLLASGQGVAPEELDELLRAEGPNTGERGTMMDGIANMANSIIGAGIVGLPYAVSQAGFFMGVTLLVVLAGVTDWTIRLVVLNAKLSGRESYVDHVRLQRHHICHSSVKKSYTTHMTLTGDTIPHVIAYIFPALAQHAILRLLVDRRTVILLCTIAISFPLSLHRDIVKLSKSSSFALVSMMVIVTAVVLRGVAVDPSLRGSPLHAFSIIRPGVFEAIGVISFAFVCHHNTMFIYQSIETPTLDRFNAVTHASTGMSLVCCLLVAVTGYLTFTDKTQGNILNNFSPDDLLINVARFCFGANMSTTIPLENYVCREVIEDYFFKGKPFSYRRHVIITGLMVFTTMAISLTTCDLGVVLEIAGGLSATALAFIFPAIAYFALIRGEWYSRQKLPAVICATFGAVVLVLSCGLTIKNAITGERGNATSCS